MRAGCMRGSRRFGGRAVTKRAGAFALRNGAACLALLTASLAALAACEDRSTAGLEPSCGPKRGLMVVRDVLAAEGDPCEPRAAALYGRAVLVPGRGSGSIWTRRTEHGTGILLTAAHVISPCGFDADCPESLRDPKADPGAATIRLTEASGVYASKWSAHFFLFNPYTPAGQIYSPGILPRVDFSASVVDAQTFEPWGSGVATPGPLVDAPLPLHDPERLTLGAATWAEAEPGAWVATVGYPFDDDGEQRELAMSVGRVLDDAEAAAVVQALRALGDDEGSIAYDAEAEFLIEGQAVRGMSGGGVYDEAGRQVGTLVRGSSVPVKAQYLRAVRTSYVVDRIGATLESLSEEQRARVSPYLELP